LDVGRGELPLDRMDVGELRIFGRSTKYRIGRGDDDAGCTSWDLDREVEDRV
jgi:hypothetical protein